MSSPTARSLAELRKMGYTAEVVERQKGPVKVDFLGCIDILAVGNGTPLGVQATSGSNHAARVKKALHEPRLLPWLADGCEFEVWSWAQRGKRGQRKRWTLRRNAIRQFMTHPDGAYILEVVGPGE